jgi:intracellular multiplication protein IcmG
MPAAMPAAATPMAIPPAAAPEAAKASSEDTAAKEKINALEKRIASLEETLSSLQSKVVTKADIESLQISMDKLQQSAEKKSAEKQPVKKAKTSKVKKAKRKTAITHPKATSSTPSAPLAPAVHWILKSAKPGTAWVAESGSNELHTVSVGDTLPGIGKVTEIAKDAAGLWIVTGSAGRISQ